jgi:hypothetical protein
MAGRKLGARGPLRRRPARAAAYEVLTDEQLAAEAARLLGR